MGKLGDWETSVAFMKENSPEVLWKKGLILKFVPKPLLKGVPQILELPVSKTPFFLKMTVLGYA